MHQLFHCYCWRFPPLCILCVNGGKLFLAQVKQPAALQFAHAHRATGKIFVVFRGSKASTCLALSILKGPTFFAFLSDTEFWNSESFELNFSCGFIGNPIVLSSTPLSVSS
jgi:hypothetical protein